MNSRAIGAGVFSLIGVLFGMYLISQVLSGQGNVLGQVYRYLLGGAFLVGLALPRFSIFLQIICAVWLDVLKKMLVFGESLYFIDLFFILGIPPIMLLGTCCAIVAQMILGRLRQDKRVTRILLTTICLVGFFSVLPVAQHGVNLSTLKFLANGAAYFGLVLVIPVLFPNPEQIMRLLKLTIWCFVPAAFHGLYHAFVGPFDFEAIYMMSGMSVNAGTMARGEGIFGPFASQGGLSGSMAIMAALCLIPLLLPRSALNGMNFFRKPLAICLFVLFLATAVFSLKRMPVIIVPLTVVLFHVLRTKQRTVVAYALGGVGFFLLVLFSEFFQAQLPMVQREIGILSGGNETAASILRVQTFNVRFEEFSHLKKPGYWTPFGIGEGSVTSGSIHSSLVEVLLRFGYVPLTAVLLCAIPVMVLVHRQCTRRDRSLRQMLFLLMFSLFGAMQIASLLGSGFVNTYPIPFLVGLFVAIALTCRFFSKDGQQAKELESSPAIGVGPSGAPGRPQFARSRS